MFDPPNDFSRPGRAVPPRPGRERHTPELEQPGRPALQTTRLLLKEPPRGQMLAVALCCLAVGVVGLILLFAGWLS